MSFNLKQSLQIIPDWCIDWLDIVLWAAFDLTLCYTVLQKGFNN